MALPFLQNGERAGMRNKKKYQRWAVTNCILTATRLIVELSLWFMRGPF